MPFKRYTQKPRISLAIAEITTPAGREIVEITIEGAYSDVIYVKPSCAITPDIEKQLTDLGIMPHHVTDALPASEIVDRALYPLVADRGLIVPSSLRDRPLIKDLIDECYYTARMHWVVNFQPTADAIKEGRFAEALSVLDQFNALYETPDTDEYRLPHTVTLTSIPPHAVHADCLGVSHVDIAGPFYNRTYQVHMDDGCQFDIIRMMDVISAVKDFKVMPVYPDHPGRDKLAEMTKRFGGIDINDPEAVRLYNELYDPVWQA